MNFKTEKDKIILCLLMILLCGCIAVVSALYTENTDFPAFYRAAMIIMDPNIPNENVYDVADPINMYNIPEEFVQYRFSLPAAYLISPLALLPYSSAKAVMTLINILAYAVSVIVLLRFVNASGRRFVWPLAFSFLWMPFLRDIGFVQVNSILLIFITIAVFMAIKDRPLATGMFLGTAALFKMFPIAIAMVLGLKNWRIFTSCVLMFSLALILPGSKEWFASFAYTSFRTEFYSVIYMWLKGYNILLYVVYVALVGGITALVAHRFKYYNYPVLTSLAIPAVLLTMPIIEYFHLVLLIFPYVYLLTQRLPVIYTIFLMISLIVIFSGGFLFPGYIITSYLIIIGLFILWVTIISLILNKHPEHFNNNNGKLII